MEQRTSDIVRGLTAAGYDRAQALGLIRKYIADGVFRPKGKAGRAGETNSFVFPEHSVEATAVVLFLHGLGLRDRDALSDIWSALLTAPAEGELTPIARILAELAEAGSESDLPALQIYQHRSAFNPRDERSGSRLFFKGTTDRSPPELPGFGVAWFMNLRLGVILEPFVAPAVETAQ
jgi:hypothetical protein